MTDLTATFTRPELDAVASATADLSDFDAIVALADRLPLPAVSQNPRRIRVTIPAAMVRAARMDLTVADDEPGEIVCSFLDRFDAQGAQR